MIIPKTFNGITLSPSGQRAVVLNANALPSANIALIEEARADSRLTDGYTVSGRSVAIRISVKNYANRVALISALKSTFKRGARGLLVATLEDGYDYQLDCAVQSLTQEKDYPLSWLAILVSGQTAWRAVTADTQSWTGITGASATQAITVGGSDSTALSATITAKGAPSVGAAYQQLYQLTNAPGYAYGNRPWCINLNTKALVDTGKMLATGYDLVVTVNGKPVNRWLSGINTTSTNIWFNANFKLGASLTLKTAIASSGAITQMVFAPTANNKKALAALSKIGKTGILVHGTEWIKYTGINAAKYLVTCDTASRGVFGTTLQAHAIGDAFLAQQNVISISYGDPTSTDPTATNANYDAAKPLFNLASSTNLAWVYTTADLFHSDTAPGRLGGWRHAQTRKGKNSEAYMITGRAASGNPALGARAMTYLQGGTQRPDTVDISWTFKNSGLISSLSMTGRSFRSGTKWIDEATCEYSESAAKPVWYDLWTEATPAASGSWSAWTHNSVSVNNAAMVRLRINGQYTDLAKYMLFEGLTASVGFVEANLPAGSLLTGVSNYGLNVTLSNDTSGESLTLDLPMLMDKTIALDAEALTVQYNGNNAHDALTLDDDGRDVWIPLAVGAQTIKIASNLGTVGTLDAVLSWYKRRL